MWKKIKEKKKDYAEEIKKKKKNGTQGFYKNSLSQNKMQKLKKKW